MPDATTLRLYREALARAGVVEQLLAAFDPYLREQGYLAMGGQRRPLGRDRSRACRQGIHAPHPPTRRAHPAAVQARAAGQHDALAGARPGRARVAPVFAHQATAMGGKLGRTIGIERAKIKIGTQTPTDNMSRFAHLQGMAAGTA